MIKAHQEAMVEARRMRKDATKELDKLNAELSRLEPLFLIESLGEVESTLTSEVEQHQQDLACIESFGRATKHEAFDLDRVQRCIELEQANSNNLSALEQWLNVSADNGLLLDSLHQATKLTLPDFGLIDKYLNNAVGLRDAELIVQTLAPFNSNVLENINEQLEVITDYFAKEDTFNRDFNAFIEEMKTLKDINEQLKASGSICPTCNQVVGDHRHELHHH